MVRAVMSVPRLEIPAVCEIHGGQRRVVVRREGERLVLDARADACCVLTLPGAALPRLFDALGEWRG